MQMHVKKRLLQYVGLLFSLFLIAGCASTNKIVPDLDKRLKLASSYSATKSGDALLIWKKDQIILEQYHNGYDRDNPHLLREITTLLSVLAALTAIDDGLITLEEPVSEKLTDWKDIPHKSKITISQLLHLTSGLKPGDKKSVPTYQEATKVSVIHPPGEKFLFGPNSFQVFGNLLSKALEESYLKQRVLLPIGVPGGRWLIANDGGDRLLLKNEEVTPRLFDGAQLTARELLRIGRLLLQEGEWNKKTIIKDISPIVQATPASLGYGLSVWLNIPIPSKRSNQLFNSFFENIPENIMYMKGYKTKRLIYDGAPADLYMAAGRGNQRLYIIPSKKMVIVRFGRENLLWSDAEFLARFLDGKSLGGVDTNYN